jgi:hypothetical protein
MRKLLPIYAILLSIFILIEAIDAGDENEGHEKSKHHKLGHGIHLPNVGHGHGHGHKAKSADESDGKESNTHHGKKDKRTGGRKESGRGKPKAKSAEQ